MKGIYMMLAMVVLFASCKKKTESTTFPPASAAVLNSVSQMPSGITTHYTYDAQGRLETVRNSDGTGTNITYSGDTVSEAMINDSGYVFAIRSAILNTSGIATTSVLRDTLGSILSHSQYLYDTANFMTDEKTFDISNNLISERTWGVSENNVYYYTVSDSIDEQIGYSYSYEKESTTGNYNMGYKFYGRSSTNIEKTRTKTGTTGSARYTFQYTFDGSNRVSTKAAYNHLNELVYTNTYTYN
jgi:YD repeat-containing protein